jgi:hypothetical protein
MAMADRNHSQRELHLIPKRERYDTPTQPDDDQPDDNPDFDDAA